MSSNLNERNTHSILPHTEKDEKEAMNPKNILKDQPRTRFGGRKPGNVNYREPGDEEGLPGPDDGTSYVRTGKTEIVRDDS